jgi:hypothetical protein
MKHDIKEDAYNYNFEKISSINTLVLTEENESRRMYN